MNSVKRLFCGLAIIGLFPLHSALAGEVTHLETSPELGGWGFDIGFVQQPFMQNAVKLAAISPHLFGNEKKGHWRLVLNYNSKRLQAYDSETINEYDLSLELNGKPFKDVAYSYVRIGAGMMDMGDLYDGSIFIMPIALGIQVVTSNTTWGVQSFFLEYRTNVVKNYDIKKSLPEDPLVGIKSSAIFSGATTMGIRMLF